MTLAEFIKLHNLTNVEFASRLTDAGESTVRKWASGERRPGHDQMREIFRVTGGLVTPNDFHGIGLALLPLDNQP